MLTVLYAVFSFDRVFFFAVLNDFFFAVLNDFFTVLRFLIDFNASLR